MRRRCSAALVERRGCCVLPRWWCCGAGGRYARHQITSEEDAGVFYTLEFPPPPSVVRGGAGADTQIPRLSFLAKSIFHRVDGSRKRRCLAAMRQWEVRVGCRRKKRNAPPRWTEAVKQWRSLAEEEGEILACCFTSRSFIPICFFVFFNITLFPFFPAARPLPSLRKLSSPPPPAKVNSQPVCGNIGGGRFGGGGGWRGGGGRVLSPALHSQSAAHTSRRRRRSERHRREAHRDDIMRAPCLGSCYPLLQTIRIIIFWGASAPRGDDALHLRRAAREKVLMRVDTRFTPNSLLDFYKKPSALDYFSQLKR